MALNSDDPWMGLPVRTLDDAPLATSEPPKRRMFGLLPPKEAPEPTPLESNMPDPWLGLPVRPLDPIAPAAPAQAPDPARPAGVRMPEAPAADRSWLDRAADVAALPVTLPAKAVKAGYDAVFGGDDGKAGFFEAATAPFRGLDTGIDDPIKATGDLLLTGGAGLQNRRAANAEAATRWAKGDEEYLRIARKAVERDVADSNPNRRMTILERAAIQQGLGDERGRATIDPDSSPRHHGARDLANALEGGATASTYFGKMSAEEIAAELKRRDEDLLRDIAPAQEKAGKEMNWRGKTGQVAGSVLHTGLSYANPMYVGRKLFFDAIDDPMIKKAPRVGMDENGQLAVLDPGGGPATEMDVLKAYGWNAFEYATEIFLSQMAGAVYRAAMPAGAQKAISGGATSLSQTIGNLPLIKTLNNTKVVQAVQRIRKSEAFATINKHTGLGSMPEEVAEEGVQGVGGAVFNIEGDPTPMHQRVGKAAVDFVKNLPYLIMGMSLTTGGKVTAAAPFERRARRQVATEDAKLLAHALTANGAEVNEKQASDFLTDLYGTQTLPASIKKIDSFMEKHGVAPDADSPFIQAMHQAFAEQDKEMHPRQRFLRGLQEGWHKERQQKRAGVQMPAEGATGADSTAVEKKQSPLFDVIPEYAAIAEFMASLQTRPVDMATGKPLAGPDEQNELARFQAMPQWQQYLKEADGDEMLAMFALRQDQQRDAEAEQAQAEQAAAGERPQTADRRPQTEDNLDMGKEAQGEQDVQAGQGQPAGNQAPVDGAALQAQMPVREMPGQSADQQPAGIAPGSAAAVENAVDPQNPNYRPLEPNLTPKERRFYEAEAEARITGNSELPSYQKEEQLARLNNIRNGLQEIRKEIEENEQAGKGTAALKAEQQDLEDKLYTLATGQKRDRKDPPILVTRKGLQSTVDQLNEQEAQKPNPQDRQHYEIAPPAVQADQPTAQSTQSAQTPVGKMTPKAVRAELHSFGVHELLSDDGKMQDIEAIKSPITLRRALAAERSNLENRQKIEAAAAEASGVPTDENSRSDGEIAKWTDILAKQGEKGRERLRAYLGSLALGRDFMETNDDYLARRGLTQFNDWAIKELGGVSPVEAEPAKTKSPALTLNAIADAAILMRAYADRLSQAKGRKVQWRSREVRQGDDAWVEYTVDGDVFRRDGLVLTLPADLILDQWNMAVRSIEDGVLDKDDYQIASSPVAAPEAQVRGAETPSRPDAAASAATAAAGDSKVDTIVGRMDYPEFERSGYSPDEVTRQNWIDLQRAERRRLGQPEGGDNPRAPWAEFEEYHRDAVKRALDNGDTVDERVLADYPDLKPVAAPLEGMEESAFAKLFAKEHDKAISDVAERIKQKEAEVTEQRREIGRLREVAPSRRTKKNQSRYYQLEESIEKAGTEIGELNVARSEQSKAWWASDNPVAVERRRRDEISRSKIKSEKAQMDETSARNLDEGFRKTIMANGGPVAYRAEIEKEIRNKQHYAALSKDPANPKYDTRYQQQVLDTINRLYPESVTAAAEAAPAAASKTPGGWDKITIQAFLPSGGKPHREGGFQEVTGKLVVVDGAPADLQFVMFKDRAEYRIAERSTGYSFKNASGKTQAEALANASEAAAAVSAEQWRAVIAKTEKRNIVPAGPEAKPAPAPKARAKVEIKSPIANLSAEKQAKAKELQDRLRSLTMGRASMGLDPEALSVAGQLAVLYVEGGAKTFQQFAASIAADMSDAWDSVKVYLHSAWQAAGAVDETLDDTSRATAKNVINWIDSERKQAENNLEDKEVDDEQQPITPESGEAVEAGAGRDTAGSESTGEGTLGDVPPENVQADVGGGDAGVGSGGSGAVGQGNDSKPDAAGDAALGGVGSGEGGNDSTARGGRSGKRGSRGRGRSRAEGVVRDAGGKPESSETVGGHPRLNYRILPDDPIGEGSPAKKIADNLEALRLIKRLDAEGRQATPEEQKTLVMYVGWGGLPKVFDRRFDSFEDYYNHEHNGGDEPRWGYYKREYEAEKNTTEFKAYIELKALLTEEEFEAARASTINAHYTAIPVVRAIHAGLRHFGFRGGRMLETSAGIGHFLGAAPDMENRTQWTAVELEPLTGKILKALYPSADVRVQGFQEASIPDNYYDVATSNVPFAEIRPHDAKLKKYRFVLHDYFFAKALAKVRPGGMMAFITSTGTLDKMNPVLRDYLAGNGAQFVGAVRLPDNAFQQNAGTSVVTDIIIFKKVLPGVTVDNSAIAELGEIKTKDGSRAAVNAYFANNPQMVLGDWTIGHGMYNAQTLSVDNNSETPLGERITAALQTLPADIFEAVGPAALTGKKSTESEKEPDFAPADVKEGNLGLNEAGEAARKINGMWVPLDKAGPAKTVALIVKNMLPIRTAVREVIAVSQQAGAEADAALTAARKRLNSSYDKFVRLHGAINAAANRKVLRNDVDFPVLLSLEKYDTDTKKATKMPIFSERVIAPPARVEKADSVADALKVSLSETNTVDMDRIAELTDRTPDDVKDELLKAGQVFRNPQTEIFEPADEYLSGYVRKKLREAREAATVDPSYEPNVTALEAVQPEDLTNDQIIPQLGAPWIEASDWREFLTSLTGGRDSFWQISHSAIDGGWNVAFLGGSRDDWAKKGSKSTEVWGTDEYPAYKLLSTLMNGKAPRVSRKEGDSYVLDVEATTLAEEKAEAMRREFADWVWRDADRKERLLRKYNDTYNDFVDRAYSDEAISLAGMNSLWQDRINAEERGYQRQAVRRAIVSGNTLLAHAVGAGKTLTVAASVMELRRLGLARKPMIVAPNHMILQWAREFQEIYPGAKLLIGYKEELATAKRKEFLARIATGNYDAVIVAHSAFGKINMSDAFQAEYMREEVKAVEDAILAARAEEREAEESSDRGRNKGKDTRLVKALEKMKANLIAKIEKLNAEEHKDQHIRFDELGVDYLFVDEAHNFKGIPINTKRARIPGIGQQASQKAQNLEMKSRYVMKLHDGQRGVVFATGTPISNSISEMYVMMRYMAPEVMRARSLYAFDDWVNMFGRTITDTEINPTGTGFRTKERFASFSNMGEMQQIFRSFTDVVLSRDLKIKRPELKDGKITIAAAKPSQWLKDYVASLQERADAVSKGSVDPRNDNMLKITGDGRKAAMDPRMIDPNQPDLPGSKLNLAVDNIVSVWKATTKDKAAQVVFSDLGIPKGAARNSQVAAKQDADDDAAPEDDGTGVVDDGKFDVYNDLKAKLVKAGIPIGQIAFIHDAETDEKKAELFAKVRSGQVRVLIGNTAKMGEGTNVQDRLAAIHHLDVPWKPAWYEQRNGRIFRSGNMFDFVQQFNYITEGSFDAYMWQTIQRKAEFIFLALSSDRNTRVLEDVEGVALTAQEMKAAASGDPIIREKIMTEHEMMKLLRKRAAATEAARRNKGSTQSKERTIKDLELELAAESDSLPRYQNKPETPVFIATDKAAHTDGVKAMAWAKDYAISKMTDSEYNDRIPVGTYLGMPVSVLLRKKYDRKSKTSEITESYLSIGSSPDAKNTNGESISHGSSGMAAGDDLFAALHSSLGRLDGSIKDKTQRLSVAKRELEILRNHVGAAFEGNEEIEKLQARLKEIDDILGVNKQDISADVLSAEEGGGDESADDSGYQVRETGPEYIVDAAQRKAYLVREGVPDAKLEAARKDVDGVLEPVQLDLFGKADSSDDATTGTAPVHGKTLSQPPAPRSRIGIRLSPQKLKAIEARTNAERAAWYSGKWEEAFSAVGEGRPVMRIIPELISSETPMAVPVAGMKIDNPTHVHAIMTAIRSPYFESFKALWLDTKGVAIRMDICSIGVLDSALVTPQSLLRQVPPGAARVILSHNHPSGDPSPSSEDMSITRQLIEVLENNGIGVMDHVITNGTRYLSFRESGLIKFNKDAYEVGIERGKPQRRSAQTVPDAQPKADWEIFEQNSVLDNRWKVMEVEGVRRVVGAFADGKPYIHVMYMNTKSVVVGIERMRPDMTATQAAARIIRNAAQVGGAGVLIHLPGDGAQLNADTLKWSRLVAETIRTSQTKMLDIVMPVGNPGDSQGIYSFREQGHISVSEDSTGYDAGGTVRETTAQAARSATPAAPGITRPEFDSTMQAEAAKTPWHSQNATAVESLDDLPAPVRQAIARGEGQAAADVLSVRYMRDGAGQVRAVTMGDKSWFILDRYNDAGELAGDIREEAFHRIENEFADADRTRRLGIATYGGKWLAIAKEIEKNYGFKPGSVEFFRELAAKAYRDGQTNRSLWGRFVDAIVAAIRRVGRAFNQQWAAKVTDAELRAYVNDVLARRDQQATAQATQPARLAAARGDQDHIQAPSSDFERSYYGTKKCHALTTALLKVAPGGEAFTLAYTDHPDDPFHSAFRVPNSSLIIDVTGAYSSVDALIRSRQDRAVVVKTVDSESIRKMITGNKAAEVTKALPLAKRLLRWSDSTAAARGDKAQNGVTPEQDAAYLAAVESGDMETAQRMVDEAARAAGYNVGPVWHGSRMGAFTAFRTDLPTYFSPDKSYADQMGDSRRFFLKLDSIKQSPFQGADFDLVKDGFDGRKDAFTGFYVVAPGKQNQIKSADPVTRDDSGRVIPLSERFNESRDDIRFARADAGEQSGPVEVRPGVFRTEDPNDVPDGATFLEKTTVDGKTVYDFRPPAHLDKTPAEAEFEKEKAESLWRQALDLALAVSDRLRGKDQKDKNARPDITKLDLLLSTISHYSEKVPGLRKMYEAAERWMDNKHRFENLIFNQGEDGRGDSDLEAVHQFTIKGRPKASAVTSWQNPEWTRLEKYLWTRDMNAQGYRAVEDERNGGWMVFGMDGKPVKQGGALQDNFTYESQAWEAAHQLESEDLRKEGYSAEATDTLLAIRRINDRAYDQLAGELLAAKDELDDLGLSMPKIKKADGEMGDIFEALRQIGDRRGYYMPRMRRSGKFKLIARKEGENPVLETFDTKGFRLKRAIELKRKGYSVEYALSDRPAESAYMDASIVAMNDMMQNALERVKKLEKDHLGLEAFNLSGEWEDYKTKNGQTEKHFIVTGPSSKQQNRIFKDIGGKWMSLDDSPKTWRFINPKGDVEKRIIKALVQHESHRMQVAAFADTITESIADMIHQRGSRSHKIGRSDATGKDVWQGYETDGLKAITLSGKSIAGGTAKRLLAKEFMRAMTGQSENWRAYRTKRMGQFLRENPGAKADEIDEESKQWYHDYAEEVSRNRIDSATQGNAYKDALSFSREMLRNEEGTERIVGTLKGLAAAKYMSSISSGLVNLTSMYTHAPAAMSAFAGIKLGTAVGPLIHGAMRDYIKFATHEKFGKGQGLTGEAQELYRDIVLRGWDTAQFNHEALAVLQGKISGAFSKAVNAGMISYAVVERLNRVATIAATYRGIKAQHTGTWTAKDHEAAMHKAKYVSDKTNSIFGKTNIPSWARGGGGGQQMLRSWYMFKSFPHNTFLLLKEAGLDQKDLKAAAWLLVAPAIIGGTSASLAAKYAIMPAAKLVLAALAAVVPGFEPPEDPEEGFYQWLAETFGEWAGRTGRFGIVGGLANVSIKGSLETRLEDWIPTTMADFLGAPASAVTDFAEGMIEAGKGNVIKGLEQAGPRATANLLRAYREATEGITGKGNQPLHYGMKPMKATWFETLQRAIGFNPATIAEMREIQWSDKQVERHYSDRRTAIYDRVRKYHLAPRASMYQDTDWLRITTEIQEYNARIKARGLGDSIPFITGGQIGSTITRMQTPPKRERVRAWRQSRDEQQD
jgi:N12 class adenine-specific DNA methylase/CRP-like cAMP-binding protein